MRCNSEAMLCVIQSCVASSHCICSNVCLFSSRSNIVCLFSSRGLLELGVQGLLTKTATEDTQGSICSILAACTQTSKMSVYAAEVNATACSLHESCCLTFAATVILDKLAAVCSISWKRHPALTGASCKTQAYSTAFLQVEALCSVPKKTVHGGAW